MFKFFEVKIKGFKMQMQEVIEKLKDILEKGRLIAFLAIISWQSLQ